MNNINSTLKFYCDNEKIDFESQPIFNDLRKLVNKSNLIIVCEYGKESDNKKFGNLYLSVSVKNQNNEFIEIYDDGFLTACTILVSVDRKERIKFYSWNDNDFIDSINWMIKNLKEKF